MQLVERWFFRDARDCLIEILMLGFELLDLESCFFVTINFLDHSSIGRRQCNKFLTFELAGISV